MQFRWIDWNRDHIAEHGVEPEEAEMVVRHARSPFPEEIEDDKWIVKGRSIAGRFLQVIYLLDPDDTVFVLHARPLTEREKKQLRRRWKT
jgi:uncharacterized DUF497 family protein